MKIAQVASLVVLASGTAFAQSPFDGTWALNQQQSNFTGQTMTIKDAGNGALTFVSPDFTYTVKTDGSKTETPSGSTVAFNKLGADSYHETAWRNGTELSQADWKISGEGKTLTIREYGTRPDGETFEDTTTYARVSGSGGLDGEWKTTAVKIGNPATFTMSMGPGDEVTWDIPAIKGTWKGTTNGTESSPSGPTVPESLTIAMTRQGPRSLAVTEKLKGKTVFTGTYTVATDGKTLTVEGKNAKGEPMKEVWEKK